MNPIHSHDPALLQRLASEAHVWVIDPDAVTDAETLEHFASLLSAEERQRYARFHFDKDRKQYLVSHALVRIALSRYTGMTPSAWRFAVNPYGRPQIDAPDAPPLRFNLTHTAGLSACVVSLGLECGIDAENILLSRDRDSVAKSMFSATELDALRKLDDSESRMRFFFYWTLRESYCKANGVGLSGSTPDFHFELLDNGMARLRLPPTSEDTADRWQFALLRPTHSHVIAVALCRPDLLDRRIVVHTLTPGL